MEERGEEARAGRCGWVRGTGCWQGRAACLFACLPGRTAAGAHAGTAGCAGARHGMAWRGLQAARGRAQPQEGRRVQRLVGGS